MRAWILYSAVRIGVFLVLFVALYALTASIGFDPAWLISALAAAALAFCISYIFFRPLRERVALDVVAARAGTGKAAVTKAGSDEAVEDTARGD
jgi:inner membrane protein involved in colicin E2 resistance